MNQTEAKLWAGPAFKIESALFHFQRMEEVLNPPLDAYRAARLSAGVVDDSGWQRSFPAYFDAFLGAVRSVPEIIQCCFGQDTANKKMRLWFDSLPADEQLRRTEFSDRYGPGYRSFRALPLGETRHVSQHRTGLPELEVTISGAFGVVYVGGPGRLVPTSEFPKIADPNLQFLAKPRALEPRDTDFTISGQLLFPVCYDYLSRAQALVADARTIASQVHADLPLTPPPA